MKVTIVQQCGCSKEISTKGPVEARKLIKWLSSVKCAECQKSK